MSILVVISTMNLTDVGTLIKRMKVSSDCIVINQTNFDGVEYLNYENINIKLISTSSRGLSKSRNLGLEMAKDTQFIYFCDDNFEFSDNYLDILNDACSKNVNCDGFIFRVFRDEGSDNLGFKEPPKRLSYISALGVATPQIIINAKFLHKHGIRFDENFGSGSQFGSGEENILLFECLSKNAKIVGVDKILGYKRNIRPSTWFKGFDLDFLFNKGAIFTRLSKRFSAVLIMQFLIRKYSIYRKNGISFLKAFKIMFDGRRYFLGLKNE